MEFRRVGIKNVLASVTGASVTEIVPAASGYILSLTQLIATNHGEANNIALYEGNTKVSPTIEVATSGTLFIDDFAGMQFELAKSSGLGVGLGAAGDFEVQAFYLLYDKRTPISQETARAVTRSNISVSRFIG